MSETENTLYTPTFAGVRHAGTLYGSASRGPAVRSGRAYVGY